MALDYFRVSYFAENILFCSFIYKDIVTNRPILRRTLLLCLLIGMDIFQTEAYNNMIMWMSFVSLFFFIFYKYKKKNFSHVPNNAYEHVNNYKCYLCSTASNFFNISSQIFYKTKSCCNAFQNA